MYSEQWYFCVYTIAPLAAPELSLSIINTTATVRWYPIACSQARGNITGYQYELSNASGSMIRERHVTATTERASFSGRLGALYHFQVRALTNGGEGPWRRMDVQFPKGNILESMLTEALRESSMLTEALGESSMLTEA